METGRELGLDFGSTHLRLHRAPSSALGMGESRCDPHPLALDSCGVSLPLALEIDEGEILAWGGEALRRARSGAARGTLVLDLKRRLESGQEAAFGWTERLLSGVTDRLEHRVIGERLGGAPGYRIAVGVPAHWSPSLCARFQQAVASGLRCDAVQLLPEPGALLQGALHREPAQGTIGRMLVVEMGATAVRTALLGRENGNLRTMEYRILPPGGEAFDAVLAQRIAERMGGRCSAQALLGARDLKEVFNLAVCAGQAEGGILLPGGEWAAIGRTEFEGDPASAGLVHTLTASLREVACGLESAPDVVFLTGCGAHWYFLEGLITDLFPQSRVQRDLTPERTLADGLALSFREPVAERIAGCPRAVETVATEAQSRPAPTVGSGSAGPLMAVVAANPFAGHRERNDAAGAEAEPERAGAPPSALADLCITLTLRAQERCGAWQQTVEIEGRRETLTIPAHAKPGMRLRFAGRGRSGSDGGPPGDLLIFLRA